MSAENQFYFGVKRSKVMSRKNIAGVSLHSCECWLLLVDQCDRYTVTAEQVAFLLDKYHFTFETNLVILYPQERCN